MSRMDISSEVLCTCGKVVLEADVAFCSDCGDVICKECYTDCLTCGKMYCINCSKSASQCLRCHTQHKIGISQDKAYLVLDGMNMMPVKNSPFLIAKTSLANARDVTLSIQGKTYRFSYRSIEYNKTNHTFEYYMYFQEIQNPWKDDNEEVPWYDDYSTLGWGY